MDGDSGQLNIEQATRVLGQVLGDCVAKRVVVVFPTWMRSLSQALRGGLEAHGCEVEVTLQPPPEPATMSVSEAADRWVPTSAEGAELLVLCGTRPWSEQVEGDYLIELEAMKRREALLAQGQRLLFIDWPRGARRDAEIDLLPLQMLALYRRAIDVDYDEMRAWNASLAERVQGAEKVRIRCPAGTDLSLSVAGRSWLLEDCQLGRHEPAVYLPGGEIYTAVREESAEGQVAFYHVGELRLARFHGGMLTSVEHEDGRPDTGLAEELGLGSEPLCELGIGTNAWAPPWQVGTLYEKSASTVHVAVGGNHHFGGQRDSPRHMDLIIRSPTLEIDGKLIALPSASWATPKE